MTRCYLVLLVTSAVVLMFIPHTEGMDRRCILPKAKGSRSCGRGSKYYYYNAEKGRCYKFIYYGCEGNKNRFRKRVDCLSTCACEAELDHGTHCNKGKEKSEMKYYYEKQSGLCRNFWFVGCGGNHNKFNSKTSCHKVCIQRGNRGKGGEVIAEASPATESRPQSRPRSRSRSRGSSSSSSTSSLQSLLAMLKKISSKFPSLSRP